MQARAKKRRFESEAAFDKRMRVKRAGQFRKPYKGNIQRAKTKAYTFLTNNTPLPRSIPAKMIYHNIYAETAPTAGATAVRIWSANGLYDLDISGAGHQPRGFDQIILLYDHYVTLSAKVTVKFCLGETINEVPILVGIAVSDQPSALTTTNDYIENSNCVYDVLSLQKDQVELSMSVNVYKFLGRSNPLADPHLKGTSAANPSEQAYFHLFMRNLSGSADTQTVIENLVHESYSVWIEPKAVSQS